MSKTEIQSWIAAAEVADEKEDVGPSFDWSQLQEESEWPAFLDYAKRQVLDSSTKRIDFLENRLTPLAVRGDLKANQLGDIFNLLILTYPRYIDGPSREAVERTLGGLLTRGKEDEAPGEGKIVQGILKWLAMESQQIGNRNSSSSAPGNQFVLLNWACVVYTWICQSSSKFSDQALKSILSTLASLLDSLLDQTAHIKQAIRRGAVVRARRAIRSKPDVIPTAITTVLSSTKGASNTLTFATLLGLIIDVSLHLKPKPSQSASLGQDLVKPLKANILEYYTTQIVMSKTPVAPHTSTALSGFISSFVTEDDFSKSILPTVEKALLRSPEISAHVVGDFLPAYKGTLNDQAFSAILKSVLSGAKSTNPTVRSESCALFKGLTGHEGVTEGSKKTAVTEVLALPKASKTSGPDHRIALYEILRSIKPSSGVAETVAESLPSLISKESNDVAVSLLTQALSTHLTFLLAENKPVNASIVTTISKEMASVKPVLRRAFCAIAGDSLWSVKDQPTDSARTFASSLLPALENNLKTVAANPLMTPAGPLEGYMALAVLLGSISNFELQNYGSDRCSTAPNVVLIILLILDSVLSKNPVIQGVTTSSATKPHFLLWSKCYQKATTIEEETWFLRALEVGITHFKAEIKKSDVLRSQFGAALVYLSVDSKQVETRRTTLDALQTITTRFPDITNWIIRDALLLRLSSKSESSGDHDQYVILQSRFNSTLSASVGLWEDMDISKREQELAHNLIIAHHPLICGKSRSTWIELCQRARVDPNHLIKHNKDLVLKLVSGCLDAKNLKQSSDISRAAFNAVFTLVFVAPSVILPSLMEQIRSDLDPANLISVGREEFSIWKTPEGTLFVDVLAKKKDVPIEKGKDAELRKWEAELRKTLATKKPANAANLSKQDKALIEAQLAKESQIRARVETIKVNLQRGLQLICSIVEANPSEFQGFVGPITSLLLAGAMKHGVPLVGNDVFETYVALSDVCSDRLGTFKKWIGISALRSTEDDVVPPEYTAEPVGQLIIRVLYRLRSLSEQAPFDIATYSYASPLIDTIISTGGKYAADQDESLEQLTLALDFIRFHCAEFSDPLYPREQTIKNLLHIIRFHPQLAQTAVPALVDLGETIRLTASPKDIKALMTGTLAQESLVRNACLQTLQTFDLTDLDWAPELWLACHDDDEQNSRLAVNVWEENGLDVPEAYLKDLLPLLEHDNAYVRTSCSYALAEAAEAWPQSISSTILSLQDFYREKGMVIAKTLDRSDPWPARLAIARTFAAIAQSFTENSVTPFFKFLISEGLGDREAEVRRGLLSAGTAVLDLHGSSHQADLISMFEDNLSATSSSETEDFVKEAVVVLFGRLARHLDKDDARIPQAIDRLVNALKTPSESVQIAVSDCLAPLVKPMKKDDLAALVDNLFNEMISSPKYAARRGAAYGLAGLIKGIGISGMKDYDIIGRLRTALDDKKHSEARQGAMFAFETLSATLGRLFEPYVPHLVPYLLASFGDVVPDVRDATQDAAKVIMGNMSAYGVKLLLPSLLSALEEKQWRTKKGSIELLGAMAYCAPTQLSISLPTVIPRLTGVLADSHTQVRTAANKSLKQFGEVISNPEIQGLVPVLLKALVDPEKGPAALTALLKTSFAHYIDASSLALVVPIIERSLRERGSETKRKAARIVGNMSSLTDPKDFVPYLSRLLPLVHVCLVDPVPEARATAAKSLGTLVERLGEVHFPDLVPGLLRTLKAETSGVDRQGAAQGLSEVLAGLGMERLEGLLPDIISNASSPRSHVKEGFMLLLVFLPTTFGVRFQPHLPKLIQPILGGLADKEEVVREAALKAGKVIINNHSHRAVDLLLPELERGLFDSSSRIRQSSVTLISDLLFKLAGISGKNEIEDDEAMGETGAADNSRKVLAEVLGPERRDRVLASIFLVRQDGVGTVRISATHVWKALVQNTPRTVREILPSIMSQAIALLVNPGPDQQETAKRTIAELCRKSGDKVFSEIVSLLQTSCKSSDDRTKEGACLALSEVLEHTIEGQREGHEDELIVMVRGTLVDDSANVRSASAKAFQSLQEAFGARAIDETIPTLLQALRQPGESSGTALQALREVMNVRANVVFPTLIPTLLAKPITSFNAKALASLVTVAGDALNKRLTNILDALVSSLEVEKDEELKDDINDAVRALLASIPDETGLNTLMLLLLGWAKHHSAARRISAFNLLGTFCDETDLDMSNYRDNWISRLVIALDDLLEVAQASWRALNSFSKTISPADMEALVVPLRSAVESIGAPGRTVGGFNLPDGIGPLVSIILTGLATGTGEQREAAAYTISYIVDRTDEAAIKPFVVRLTGPLIRAHSAGYPPNVKNGIVVALTTMLQRIPMLVKPFFPQLQRTFVKAASDPSSFAVRSQAAVGLGALMAVQARVDPLVTELITTSKSSDEAIAASLILALAHVVKSASANLGDGSKAAVAELISDAFRESHDDYYVQAIASLFANMAPFPELLRPIVDTYVIGSGPSMLTSHVIRATIEESPELFYTLSCVPAIVQKINVSISENPSISRPARESKELMKTTSPYADDDTI
ncbi:hypothetical protein M422DRAFT_43931 [Sphaerobolus stellatus SS14]|nr:hypothetical protein M422DRAFT_43931 [Sphaerobolus stellatus SS14]